MLRNFQMAVILCFILMPSKMMLSAICYTLSSRAGFRQGEVSHLSLDLLVRRVSYSATIL